MKNIIITLITSLLISSHVSAATSGNLYYKYRQSFKYILQKELFKSIKANSCINFKPIADSYYRLAKDGKSLAKVAEKAKYIAEYYSFIDRNEKEFYFFKKNSTKSVRQIQSLKLDLDDEDLRSIVLGSKIISPEWKLNEVTRISKFNLFRNELGLDLFKVTAKKKERIPNLKTVLAGKESLLIIKLSRMINVYGGKFFFDFESFFFKKKTDVKKMFAVANIECEHLLKEVNNVIMLSTRLLRSELNFKKEFGFNHDKVVKNSCKYKKKYPLICRGHNLYEKYKRSLNKHKAGIPVN